MHDIRIYIFLQTVRSNESREFLDELFNHIEIPIKEEILCNTTSIPTEGTSFLQFFRKQLITSNLLLRNKEKIYVLGGYACETSFLIEYREELKKTFVPKLKFIEQSKSMIRKVRFDQIHK